MDDRKHVFQSLSLQYHLRRSQGDRLDGRGERNHRDPDDDLHGCALRSRFETETVHVGRICHLGTGHLIIRLHFGGQHVQDLPEFERRIDHGRLRDRDGLHYDVLRFDGERRGLQRLDHRRDQRGQPREDRRRHGDPAADGAPHHLRRLRHHGAAGPLAAVLHRFGRARHDGRNRRDLPDPGIERQKIGCRLSADADLWFQTQDDQDPSAAIHLSSWIRRLQHRRTGIHAVFHHLRATLSEHRRLRPRPGGDLAPVLRRERPRRQADQGGQQEQVLRPGGRRDGGRSVVALRHPKPDPRDRLRGGHDEREPRFDDGLQREGSRPHADGQGGTLPGNPDDLHRHDSDDRRSFHRGQRHYEQRFVL